MPKTRMSWFFLFPLPFSGFLYGEKNPKYECGAPPPERLLSKQLLCGFTGRDTEPVRVFAG